MAEETAEVVAGPEFPHPFLDPGLFLFNAARPQPIDQDPHAVIAACRFVGALDNYHRSILHLVLGR